MANESIPATAKAVWQDLETDTVTLRELPVPVPKPGTDEHLIRVHATALCARELLWPKLFPMPGKSPDLVPGYDLAGTVVAAPADSPFQAGAEVWARTDYLRPGCLREYTIGRTSELALKSRRLDWAEAATVPLSALTAWQALFVQAGLSKQGAHGKRLLVTAAAGGVGVWIVQFAKAAGIEVVGTCGPDNVQALRELGASEVVNYRTTTLGDWVAADPTQRKVDVVIDCVGGATLRDCWACVKDGGTLISIVDPPASKKPDGWAGADVTNFFFIMEPNGAQLAEITALLDQGKFRTALDSVWELEDFEKAIERVDSGHAKGKVVVKIAA